MELRNFSWLGLGFIAFGLFVLLIAIPYAVTSPSNVRALVLAPTFWPAIVSWLIIGLGAILIVLQFFRSDISEADESSNGGHSHYALPSLRIAATAAVMIGLVWITPILGMVWTAMIAFFVLSIIIGSSRPVVSLVVAIVLPLVLYAFFNHIAGVAVPQGEFIQLP